jgi:hypothetical protein
VRLFGVCAAWVASRTGRVLRERVLAQAGLPVPGPRARSSQIDDYLPFIVQTLQKFPVLTASRLYAMVRERGYRGGPDHFRHLIAVHRPVPKVEAYLAREGLFDAGLQSASCSALARRTL